jgi:hypothetical protein
LQLGWDATKSPSFDALGGFTFEESTFVSALIKIISRVFVREPFLAKVLRRSARRRDQHRAAAGALGHKE